MKLALFVLSAKVRIGGLGGWWQIQFTLSGWRDVLSERFDQRKIIERSYSQNLRIPTARIITHKSAVRLDFLGLTKFQPKIFGVKKNFDQTFLGPEKIPTQILLGKKKFCH